GRRRVAQLEDVLDQVDRAAPGAVGDDVVLIVQAAEAQLAVQVVGQLLPERGGQRGIERLFDPVAEGDVAAVGGRRNAAAAITARDVVDVLTGAVVVGEGALEGDPVGREV